MKNTVGFTKEEKKFVPILKNLKEIWEKKKQKTMNTHACVLL